jgi:Bacterial PH domain
VKEHGFEPVAGLPALLPPGEALIWRGKPSWLALANRALHLRGVAVYFTALLVWRGVSMLTGGVPIGTTLRAALWIGGLASAAMAVLAALAWLFASTTVYTITSRRIIIRFGIALPATINIPFRSIESAALRSYADGTGDVPVKLAPAQRVGYLVMWPHIRPWRFTRTEPMLRGVPEAARVAQILARALAAHAEQPAPVLSGQAGAGEPSPAALAA